MNTFPKSPTDFCQHVYTGTDGELHFHNHTKEIGDYCHRHAKIYYDEETIARLLFDNNDELAGGRSATDPTATMPERIGTDDRSGGTDWRHLGHADTIIDLPCLQIEE